MKRCAYIIAALAVLFPAVSSCSVSKYGEIRLSSFDIESFSLESSRAVSFVALVGVDNPAPQFRIDTVSASVKAGGRDMIYLSASNVSVAARRDSVYRVPVKGVLAPGINVLYVLGAVKESGRDAFTADLDAKIILRNSLGKTIEYRDVELKGLIGAF